MFESETERRENVFNGERRRIITITNINEAG